MVKQLDNSKTAQPVQPTFEGMIEGTDAEQALEPMDGESSAPLSVYSEKPVFNPEDITPPILKLMQALSPDVVEGSAKSGQWVLTGFDPQESVTIVPISFARRREYRADNEPIVACASFDGETGEGTPGGICADCPMNKWTGEGKTRKGPACVFMYSYMVYVAEFDSIALINFKRTGLGVGRALNSIVSRSAMGQLAVRLQSKLQTGGRGSYYIPQILPLKPEAAVAPIDAAKKMLGM